MEHDAAWGQPWEFQLASWSSAEVPCAHAWAPAGLAPVMEYEPMDIFGNTSLQPYFHSSCSSSIGQQQQQLALYNCDYIAASQTEHGDQNALAFAEESSSDDDDDALIMRVFEGVKQPHGNEALALLTKLKMHRCPPDITRALGQSYTDPRVVAIGPFHRAEGAANDRKDLMAAEAVKLAAGYHCVTESRLGEKYDVVFREAGIVRYLYSKDERAVRGGFRRMMFYDACFLVQFILITSKKKRKDARCEPDSPEQTPYMYNFFNFNENNILRDIMLLENQIPWQVVDTIARHMGINLRVLIAAWRDRLQVFERPDRLQVRRVVQEEPADGFDPPHFLGYVWSLVVGRGSRNITKIKPVEKEEIKAVSISVSATELAEIGINIRANKTAVLRHMGLVDKMGVSSRGVFFAELSMAPVSLDDTRASWLVNMAAFELRTTPDFLEACYQDSTVCSYLYLLCMLVQKLEDVDLLRAQGILQGGGAVLTNKEALRLFTSLHSCLRLGGYYGRVMVQIDSHRSKWWIQVYAFGYRHWKMIFGIVSGISAFAGILKTLMSLKGSHH